MKPQIVRFVENPLPQNTKKNHLEQHSDHSEHYSNLSDHSRNHAKCQSNKPEHTNNHQNILKTTKTPNKLPRTS